MNSKVIKKVANPLTPPFQVSPLFLAKNFESPQVTQFLEGPHPHPHPPLIRGVGGGGFQLCVYLKDMYITLKGTGKILFVLVLRILLICKFLNFTADFTKKVKLSKVCIQFFCVRKLISV